MKKLAIFSHACVIETNKELFLELQKKFEILIINPTSWKGSLIKDLRANHNTNSISYPTVFSGNGSLFFYKSLFKEVKQFKPDLIFCDEEPWSIVAAQIYLSFPSTKKIFYTKQNLKKKLPAPFEWIQKRIFDKSAASFVISNEAAEVLSWKNFNKQKIILPHSFNANNFIKQTEEKKQKIRSKYQLIPNHFTVGYFGRLTPEKGISTIFESLKYIMAKGVEDITFVLVGNGTLRLECEAESRSFYNNLKLYSAIPHAEVHELMSAMDLTILPSLTTPSWKEQFGRVIIESAACGIPIIGSSSGEIPKLIDKLGGGISFSEGNAQELADSILNLYKNRDIHIQYSENAYKNAHSFFTHQAVSEELSKSLLKI